MSAALTFGTRNPSSGVQSLAYSVGQPVYDDAILRQARTMGATTFRPGTTSSTPTPAGLTFGGVPEVQNPFAVESLTFGGTPQRGVLASMSSFLTGGAWSLGTPVAAPAYDDAGLRAARGLGTFTPQTIPTANLDGQTGFVAQLRDTLGGVLAGIGSTGDGAVQPVPVGYTDETGGGINWPVILLALGAAGLVYYAASN